MSRRASPRRGRAQKSVTCEGLETRRLLSTINWTNRATTDSFGTYGANAAIARAIVDRAIGDWARIIDNFNYDGGGNTFSVTVTCVDQGGGGRGVCNNITRNNSTQKKPISAQIQLDDNGGGSGWYFDPTIGTASTPDDSEFDSLLTPFTADATGQSGNDFYRTIVHELGHAMGITDDTGFLRIGDFLSNSVADPNGGTLRALNFNGGAIDYTLTTTGGGHLWEGGNAPGYTGPSHPNDLMNDGRTVNLGLTRRQVITDTDAFLLRDVYGYTVNTPSSVNNLYASQNINNGQVIVRGLNGNNSDTQVVDAFSILGINFLSFSVNGLTENYIAGAVGSIVLNGGGGTDFLRQEVTLGKPVTINGGDGDDFIDFAFGNRNLGNIAGNSQVNGGNGYDQIFVYDNSVGAAQTYTITAFRFDRPGWGGFSYAADIEHEQLTTGTGADTVNIPSTFTNQPVVVASAGGADTVNIGNATNGMQSIAAEIQIQNDPNWTTINLNNAADTGNRTWLVNDPNTGFGGIIGLAPVLIAWDNADVNAINMTCGSGVDNGVIARLSETLNINNTNGDNVDTIRVGDASAGGMQSITQGRVGGLTIDNDPDYTQLVFDDTGDAAARVVTLDFIGGYNQLTGIAPATIRYDDADTQNVTIRSGSGNDTVNVLRASGVGYSTTITSVGGNDIVNLGNGTTGVQEISFSPLHITNPPSFSTLNINNGPDTVARTVNIDVTGSTVESINGLCSSTIDWNTSDISQAGGVNVTTGSAVDTINVLRNMNNLFISTAGGGDIATVGNNTTGCDDIENNVTFQNPPSFTNLTVNDTGNSTGRTWTLASAGGFGQLQISPFLMISYKLADTASPVTLNCGPGSDTVQVAGVDTRSIVINAGDGDDTVNIGANAAGVVDPINASVAINGQGGTDRLHFENAADGTESGFTVSGGTVSQTDMANCTYSGVESLDLTGGTGGTAVHTFVNTPAGTLLFINPGASYDQIRVTNNPQPLTVRPSGGFDDVTVNHLLGAGGLVYFDATIQLGSLTLNANARAVDPASGTAVSVRSLAINATAQLDLYDNALVWDYSGASPVATLQSYLSSGYAGGAWSGFGVGSSVAAVVPGTALGFAEATDLFGAFPAPFAGLNVDSTSLLVRYTLYGDANLDKTVGIADFSAVAANFNVAGTRWSRGNFNYDGATNIADFSLLAGNFNQVLARAGGEQPTSGLFSRLRVDEVA